MMSLYSDAPVDVVANTREGSVKLKIAALMQSKRDGGVFALVHRARRNLPIDTSVSFENSRNPVGKLLRLTSVFGQTEEISDMEPLFSVVVFDDSVAEGIKEQSYDFPHVHNLKASVFAGGKMRVQCSGTGSARLVSSRKHNQARRPQAVEGFVCGDMSNVVIDTDQSSARLSWAGVIVGRKGKKFAKEGDGGTPIMSKNDALVGFLVAKQEHKVLFVGAEQLAKGFAVRFISNSARQARRSHK